MGRFLQVLACGISLSAPGLLAQRSPFTVESLLQIQRISEPALSPDGKQVAFTVQTVDMDKNSKSKQIWIVPLSGGTARPLTQALSDGANNERPRWAPNSRDLYFISDRAGSAQIWTMNSEGRNARQ